MNFLYEEYYTDDVLNYCIIIYIQNISFIRIKILIMVLLLLLIIEFYFDKTYMIMLNAETTNEKNVCYCLLACHNIQRNTVAC